MRIVALLLTVATGTLLMAPASAEDTPGEQENRKSADKVNELQRERVATLKTLAEVETSLLKIGRTSPETVLEARALVCEAELDVAEKASDRITALKSLVEVLKELEGTAKARQAAAEASAAPMLKVKARRLEAEIRLERAQAKAQGQAKNAEPQREKVVVTSVQTKDVSVTENFVCEIRSQRHIDVRSLQSGYLEEIHVKEGQVVKQGDVLFKLAPLLYQARLDAAMAEVEVAALNLKSTEKLFQNKVVSEDEVAQSRAKLTSAEAKAKLARAELNLTVVRAPFDGLIDRLQAQQGSLVTEREALTTLSDNSVMWVYFNVPQAEYLESMANPANDHAAETELVLAGGRKFSQRGKIAAVEAQFDKETGAIAFRANFPNPDGLLRHGLTGNVLVHRNLKNAVVIPQPATFEALGKRYAYIIDQEDVAHRREIVVQRELPDEFIIQRGLDVGDRIVLDGIRQVQDGEKLEYDLRKP